MKHCELFVRRRQQAAIGVEVLLPYGCCSVKLLALPAEQNKQKQGYARTIETHIDKSLPKAPDSLVLVSKLINQSPGLRVGRVPALLPGAGRQ